MIVVETVRENRQIVWTAIGASCRWAAVELHLHGEDALARWRLGGAIACSVVLLLLSIFARPTALTRVSDGEHPVRCEPRAHWKLTTLPPGMTHSAKIYAPSRIAAFMVGGSTPSDNKGTIAHWNGSAWSTMAAPTVSVTNEKSAGTTTWMFVTGRARPRRAP